MFLCDPNGGLDARQKSALKKFKRIVVAGGTNAVSTDTANTIADKLNMKRP